MIALLMLGGCGWIADLQAEAQKILDGTDVTLETGSLDPIAGVAALQTVSQVVSVSEIQSLLGAGVTGEDISELDGCTKVSKVESGLVISFDACATISGEVTVTRIESGLLVVMEEGFSANGHSVAGGLGIARQESQQYSVWSVNAAGEAAPVSVSTAEGESVAMELELLAGVEDTQVALAGMLTLLLEDGDETLLIGGLDTSNIGSMPILLDPASGCACPMGGTMAWPTTAEIPIDPNDVTSISGDLGAVMVTISGTLILDYVEETCGELDASFDATSGAVMQVGGTEIEISEETAEAQINKNLEALMGESSCEVE
jgi:hypothetical protein